MEFIYNRYLFQCDSLYKKKLNNIKASCSIKSLTIKLPLNEFVKDINTFSNVNSSSTNIQEKAFMLFYINYFLCPYINIVKNILNLENAFVLKFSFSNLKAEKFLFFFMNDVYYSFFETLLQKNISKNFFINNSLLLKCNYINNYGFRFYLDESLDIINLKKLSFFTYLVYNN
jgi:hypothetical protein